MTTGSDEYFDLTELTGHPDLARTASRCQAYDRRTNISALLVQLYREAQTEDLAQELAIEALQLQIVVALTREQAPNPAQPPGWLQYAKQFLHETDCAKHSMAELSAVLRVHPKEIVRVFRRFLHSTPAQYQRSLRVETARKLLLETDGPIAQVAAEAGFCDQAYFNHRFKRAMKCTPAEYRSQFSARPKRQ